MQPRDPYPAIPTHSTAVQTVIIRDAKGLNVEWISLHTRGGYRAQIEEHVHQLEES